MNRWRRHRPKGRDLYLSEPDYEIRTDPAGGAPTLWAAGADDEWLMFYGHDSASARELAENVEKWADALHAWEGEVDPDDRHVG